MNQRYTAMGSLSFGLTLTISCGMLLVLAWLIRYGIDLPLLIGFPLYILALTAIFFLPLQSVHLVMAQAKDMERRRIGGLFRSEYSRLPEISDVDAVSQDEETRCSVKIRMEYLADLDRLFRTVESMSVWPFNVSMLGQFFSLVAIPILLFIFQLFTENALTRMLGWVGR